MNDDRVLGLFHSAADAVAAALERFRPEERRRGGQRPGQYNFDLAADAAAVAVLTGGGLDVLSEESGRHGNESGLLAVLDPVDGSTNAAQGLPWYATSICAIDDAGPRVALVVNQVSNSRYEAVRGEGARRDGEKISPSSCGSLDDAFVAVCGYPASWPRWRQYRALGAAALDMCAVADGTADAFWDVWPDQLAAWDYLGAALVCREAGARVEDALGRDLFCLEQPRSPVAAATPGLLSRILVEAAGRGSRPLG